MTRDIDLTNMTTDKKILEPHRQQLETEIKVTFTWLLGNQIIWKCHNTVRVNKILLTTPVVTLIQLALYAGERQRPSEGKATASSKE